MKTNSFAKFQKVPAKAGQTASDGKKATASNAADIRDRILTVDIKTMRQYMRDEKNFNNPQTILEVFGEFQAVYLYKT